MRYVTVGGLVVGLFLGIAAIALAQVGFRSTMVLQGSQTLAGQPIQFPQSKNQMTALLLEVEQGGQVGRHQHPVPTFVYVLDGEISVEIEGREPLRFRQGQAYLEAVNMWHNVFNRGQGTARLLVVFAGEEGKPGLVRP